MFIKLLILQIIIVFIIDLSGFINNLKSFISKQLTGHNFKVSLKPFDCSLCMTFWVCIIFTLVNSEFTLVNLLITSLLSYFTPITNSILLIIKDLIVYTIKKLESLL